MSAFSFRLARVARVRHIAEELARAAWIVAQRVVAEAETRRAAMRHDLECALDDLLQTQRQPQLAPVELLALHGVIDGSKRALLLHEKRLNGLRAEAERMQGAYERARRERESLQKLERRSRERHLDNEERAAGRALDEVALRRASRARAGAPPPDNHEIFPRAETHGPRDGAPTP